MPEISEGCVGARKVLQKKHQLRKFTRLLGWPRHYQDIKTVASPNKARTGTDIFSSFRGDHPPHHIKYKVIVYSYLSSTEHEFTKFSRIFMTWEGAKHNSQCAWVLSHHYTHDNAAKKTTVLKLCLLWSCAPKWGGHPATLEEKSIPHKAGLRHRPWPGAPHVQGISKVKYFANIAEKFAYKKRQCMFTNHMTIQAYLTKDTDFEGTLQN